MSCLALASFTHTHAPGGGLIELAKRQFAEVTAPMVVAALLTFAAPRLTIANGMLFALFFLEPSHETHCESFGCHAALAVYCGGFWPGAKGNRPQGGRS